ncbi:hypothetical protein NDU88_002843 [Pleurodeles waltl]|uniref:Uncharacterized protein n=1 Tax=Pleurodeles waltl TaxID=8319 RepID=A0AAV7L2E9_PLEWA|nr:hypothetical protein NDU88_002843 [Pleurodeles waltl]
MRGGPPKVCVAQEGSGRPSPALRLKDREYSDIYKCEDVLELDYNAKSDDGEEGEECKDDGVGNKWMPGLARIHRRQELVSCRRQVQT